MRKEGRKEERQGGCGGGELQEESGRGNECARRNMEGGTYTVL